MQIPSYVFLYIWDFDYSEVITSQIADMYGYIHHFLAVFRIMDKNIPVDQRRGPAQDVPFFYMPSHLIELQSFKSIILTDISGIFIFK